MFLLATLPRPEKPLKVAEFWSKVWNTYFADLCDSRLELQMPNQNRLMIRIIQCLPQPGYSPHAVSTAAPSGLLIQYNQKYALCYSHHFTIQAGDINCFILLIHPLLRYSHSSRICHHSSNKRRQQFVINKSFHKYRAKSFKGTY